MVNITSLKIIFAGSPEFAAVSLQALIAHHYIPQLVLTQPDKPKGRGQALQSTPVKKLALAHDIKVAEPTQLGTPEVIEQIKMITPDLIIVAAYGMLVPKVILEIPSFKCINVHASLLSRWRGASPIQHALLAGDIETGVSIMEMVETLDAGPYYSQTKIKIDENDNAQTLHDKLASAGAKLLIQTLPEILSGKTPRAQDLKAVTYAPKISKTHAEIRWEEPAETIAHQVRAFYGWPVAFTHIQEHTIRIWQAAPLMHKTTVTPGTIMEISAKGIDVAAGLGILRLETLQFAGGKPLSAAEIIKSKQALFAPGNKFV